MQLYAIFEKSLLCIHFLRDESNYDQKTIETFEDQSQIKLKLEDYVEDKSVYEKALISKGLPFACSVIPHSKYFDHSYCGEDYNIIKKKIVFPVHIVINYKGHYLALFNDGLIRNKTSVKLFLLIYFEYEEFEFFKIFEK